MYVHERVHVCTCVTIGVTDIELLAALTLTQLAILIGQMALMIVVAVEGFKVCMCAARVYVHLPVLPCCHVTQPPDHIVLWKLLH